MRLHYTVQYGNETHQSCSQLYFRLIPRCLSWMSLYLKRSYAEHQYTNQHTCDYQSKNQPVNHLAVCLNTSHGFNYVLAYLLPLTHTHGHAHFYTVISPAESALKYQPYAVPCSPGLSIIQVNSTLVEQNTPPATATFGGSTPPVSSSPAPDRRITGGEHSITPSDMWGEHTRYCIAGNFFPWKFLADEKLRKLSYESKIDPFFHRNIAEIICSPWSIHRNCEWTLKVTCSSLPLAWPTATHMLWQAW